MIQHTKRPALITDIVDEILITRDDVGRGGAATEFVLSIARWNADPNASAALHVTDADLACTVPFAETVPSAPRHRCPVLVQFI